MDMARHHASEGLCGDSMVYSRCAGFEASGDLTTQESLGTKAAGLAPNLQ